MKVDHRTRAAFQSAAQHLHHGGFEIEEIGRMLGVHPRVARELVEAAEAQRPKLCQSSCVGTTFPMCPYCLGVWCLHVAVAVERAITHTPRALD